MDDGGENVAFLRTQRGKIENNKHYRLSRSGEETMRGVINIVGGIAAIAGILVCVLAVAWRFTGDPIILGLEARTVFMGGIGLMVFYIVTKVACPKQ